MSPERIIRESAAPSGRVATLAFLSKYLPVRLLGEPVAQSMGEETGASVVLVRLSPQSGSTLTTGRRPGDLILNGRSSLPPQLPRMEAGFHFLDLIAERYLAGIKALVARKTVAHEPEFESMATVA